MCMKNVFIAYQVYTRRKGFTLIELLQVIVIIGILAALAAPRFINFRDEARAARDQGVLAALRSAVYLYYVQTAAQGNATYPPTIESLRSLIRWDPPELQYEYTWEYNNTTP